MSSEEQILRASFCISDREMFEARDKKQLAEWVYHKMKSLHMTEIDSVWKDPSGLITHYSGPVKLDPLAAMLFAKSRQ